MNHRQRLTAIAAFLGMLALIMDGRTAMNGAIEGIRLCMETVIPSLFPFFFLSIWITGSLCGSNIQIMKPLTKGLGIPEGAESILVVGFLGGYPVGAQATANLWRSGALKAETAQRLLAFCSNAGPGFLFGIAASLFSHPWMGWCLWGIQIVSALSVAILLPVSRNETASLPRNTGVKATDALNRAVRAMVSVCGWIVLFRVIVAFGDRWVFWRIPTSLRAFIIGILELSNGCCALAEVDSEALRFILCSGMLSFGGCCVAMQTVSVTSGLSMKYYVAGKTIQTILSLLLSWAVMYGFWPQCMAVWTAAGYLLCKKQIRSSIFVPAGV